MSTKKKLLEKAINNPYGLSYKDFETLLEHFKWKCPKNNAGSHKGWISPEGQKLMIQNNKGKAKGYQVKQFLNYLSQEHML